MNWGSDPELGYCGRRAFAGRQGLQIRRALRQVKLCVQLVCRPLGQGCVTG
jgi:hypothetical protein